MNSPSPILSEVIRLQPDVARSYAQRGSVYAQSGTYELAIAI